MSDAPGKKMGDRYRVIDTRELDDLVVWCQQSISGERLANCLQDVDRRGVLKDAVRLRFFLGPPEQQRETPFPPGPILADDEQATLYISLTDDQRHTAFLYFTGAGVELHLPEIFFVTGGKALDAKRYETAQQIAAGLAATLEVAWNNLECGGVRVETPLDQAAWEKCAASIRSRIDCETL
jgi:hypothetical protein